MHFVPVDPRGSFRWMNLGQESDIEKNHLQHLTTSKCIQSVQNGGASKIIPNTSIDQGATLPVSPPNLEAPGGSSVRTQRLSAKTRTIQPLGPCPRSASMVMSRGKCCLLVSSSPGPQAARLFESPAEIQEYTWKKMLENTGSSDL